MKSFMFLATTALALFLIASVSGAASIGINFGADEPDGARSDVSGPAGVLGTANWNNVDGASGFAGSLVDGAGAATAAAVEWSSPNTWSSTGRGEENNTAPAGDDRNLMTGYLDTQGEGGQGANVVVSGLTGIFPGDTYNVYVYIKGGVNGRGGDYTIGAQTQSHVDVGPFTGTYVFGSEGDVLVFPGVSGDSFTLDTAAMGAGTQRAGVDAVEISDTLVPEPSSLVLIGLAVAFAVGIVRRR